MEPVKKLLIEAGYAFTEAEDVDGRLPRGVHVQTADISVYIHPCPGPAYAVHGTVGKFGSANVYDTPEEAVSWLTHNGPAQAYDRCMDRYVSALEKMLTEGQHANLNFNVKTPKPPFDAHP